MASKSSTKPGSAKNTASATTDAEPAVVRPKKAATSLSEAKAAALDLLEEKPKRVRRKPERVEPPPPPPAPAEPSTPAKPPKVTLAEQKAQALSIWTDDTEKPDRRKRSAEDAKSDTGSVSASSLLKPISKILAEKE